MKKNVVIAMLMAAALVLPATAEPTIKMMNDWTPSYTAQILPLEGFAGYSQGDYVDTFCLEVHEYFHPGSSYYAVLNDKNEAVNGGQDWAGGVYGQGPRSNVTSDPIDPRTAYLFTLFNEHKSDFADQNKQSMLASAIHYIEAEITDRNEYVTLAEQAVNSGAWSGIGNVRVMNLYSGFDGTTYTGYAQDQLIMVNPVPAPGAVILGSIGVMVVGYLRRRSTL